MAGQSAGVAGPTPRHPLVAASRASEPGVEAEGRVVPPRLCGRCRELFDGDPTLHRRALAEWWVCSECRAVLFGASR